MEPIKFFFADDDEDDRFLFKDTVKDVNPNTKLKLLGVGQELMNYLVSIDNEQPDLIFLDINMPCKSGIECLEEIRNIHRLDKVPVIIFSTTSFKIDVEETFNKGANLFVTKPVAFKDEFNILKQILSLNERKSLWERDERKLVMYAKGN